MYCSWGIRFVNWTEIHHFRLEAMGFINLLNVDTVDYRLSECLILNNHQISFPIDFHSRKKILPLPRNPEI